MKGCPTALVLHCSSFITKYEGTENHGGLGLGAWIWMVFETVQDNPNIRGNNESAEPMKENNQSNYEIMQWIVVSHT